MGQLTTEINRTFEKIKTPKFLQKKGLSGEVPFFIFPYEIKEEPKIEDEVNGLEKRLKKEGVRVLKLDLYDMSIDILNNKGGIEKMFRLEERKKDKPDYFLKALQSALNIQEVFMPYINERVENTEHDIVFITGAAPVYPYIRSHNILENLQNITGNVPTILFYPGVFSGKSLSLFNTLKAVNYYRAYNLNLYQK